MQYLFLSSTVLFFEINDVDVNFGDNLLGNGSGNDIMLGGEEDDTNTANGGRDIFVCGEGENDTVTDFNEAEGDLATPDCENI